MLTVEIVSSKKGSNPGGKCVIQECKFRDAGYIKYCNLSEVPAYSAEHQPIYEALTLAMARKIGLKTPRFFLLDNRQGQVKFRYAREDGKQIAPLNERKPFYFFSEFIGHPQENHAGDILEREKFYRDLLHVGDIEGKPQNYAKETAADGSTSVVYIDLGHGFTDTREGILRRRNSAVPKEFSGQELRTLHKRAARYHFTLNNSDVDMTLDELGQSIPSMPVPFLQLPYCKEKPVGISTLLSGAEIAELQATYYSHLERIIQDYRDSDKLHNGNREEPLLARAH